MDAFVFSLILGVMSPTCWAEVPKYTLNNGRQMPAIALGTFLGLDKPLQDKQYRDVISEAIDIGYRHFDTAAIYRTESEVGEGVRRKIKEGVVDREDIFITTKLWNTLHKREQVFEGLNGALENLGLEYVDLYLMHWPMGLNDDYTFSDVDYMETWRAMEDAQRMGLTKSIGVCNFNQKQLQRLVTESSIKPAVLQIEVHPQITQADLVDYAQSQNIVVMGFSPFGSLVMRYGIDFPGPKIDSPVLVSIARRYGKTTPQVVLRWLVDRNIVPIAKTVKKSRLMENINIFDFQLEPEEIKIIYGYDSGTRYTLPSFWQTHRYYPFEKIANPVADPFA